MLNYAYMLLYMRIYAYIDVFWLAFGLVLHHAKQPFLFVDKKDWGPVRECMLKNASLGLICV